jgi:PiT family inorganic phosphate transporter
MVILILTAVLAFYVAWNLGANDVANSMGTSVGSKAVSLKQALIIAGVLEFGGAVLFGRQVTATLMRDVVDPGLFSAHPQMLLMGMVAVLIACGIWLQIATTLGLPVASSHAVVGAIAGFAGVSVGFQAIAWQTIGIISLSWMLTPIISGAIAALFYSLIHRWVLTHPHPLQQLYEWIPWLSTALVGVFGLIVLPHITDQLPLQIMPFPKHSLILVVAAMAIATLTLFSWHWLTQTVKETGESQRSLRSPVEGTMAQFQLLSACLVAFAHGSNDVGNAIAPFVAIVDITQTGVIPADDDAIPLWILILGGCGIVLGLALWGKAVMTTIGEGIMPLQPSSGFCAELGAATTILLASQSGLPVSTSHAIVGGVVGIGLVQRLQAQTQAPQIHLKTLMQIALAWIVTVPITIVLSAGVYSFADWWILLIE